jgi:hypothetical protein
VTNTDHFLARLEKKRAALLKKQNAASQSQADDGLSDEQWEALDRTSAEWKRELNRRVLILEKADLAKRRAAYEASKVGL